MMIILSLHHIPTKPFFFYALCMLDAIAKHEIELNGFYSEFYFDDLISVIDNRVEEQPSQLFVEFIHPIKEICNKLKANEINHSYTSEEIQEVASDADMLIKKITNM